MSDQNQNTIYYNNHRIPKNQRIIEVPLRSTYFTPIHSLFDINGKGRIWEPNAIYMYVHIHSQKLENICVKILQRVQVTIPTLLQILKNCYKPTENIRLCFCCLDIIWIICLESILSISKSI